MLYCEGNVFTIQRDCIFFFINNYTKIWRIIFDEFIPEWPHDNFRYVRYFYVYYFHSKKRLIVEFVVEHTIRLRYMYKRCMATMAKELYWKMFLVFIFLPVVEHQIDGYVYEMSVGRLSMLSSSVVIRLRSLLCLWTELKVGAHHLILNGLLIVLLYPLTIHSPQTFLH